MQNKIEGIPKGLAFGDQIREMRVPGSLSKKAVLNKRIPELEDAFADMESLLNASLEDLEDAFETKSLIAIGIYQYFHNFGGEKIVDQLRNVGLTMEHRQTSKSAWQPLTGKTFVITGKLTHFASRREAEEAVKAAGGSIGSAVSGNTDYLVAGENTGKIKMDRARDLSIDIITEKQLIELVGSRDR